MMTAHEVKLDRPIEVSVDPISLILHGKAYEIWWHRHHPVSPDDLREMLTALPAMEQKATLQRAEKLSEVANFVKEILS